MHDRGMDGSGGEECYTAYILEQVRLEFTETGREYVILPLYTVVIVTNICSYDCIIS
jgi:glutamate synthase domain-containing protein 1